MFFYAPIKANDLPDKVLCLTFDDGPDNSEITCEVSAKQSRETFLHSGPQTLLLAKFLHEQGIQATFFVLGDRAKNDLDTLFSLRHMGHLIANHTNHHPNLVKLQNQGGDLIQALLFSEILLRNILFSNQNLFTEISFFRPPYGRWKGSDDNFSQVADILNKETLLKRCVGPIHWDIDSRDWYCWRDNLSVEACADKCIENIEKKGKGIVLMHDSNFEDAIREKNNTYTLCRIIIPKLLKMGYRFVRLDAIPQVISATLVSQRFYLRTFDKKFFISVSQDPQVSLLTTKVDFGEHEELGMVDLNNGKIAIRVSNGKFLSCQGNKDSYSCSLQPNIGVSEIFQLIRFSDQTVALKNLETERFISIAPQEGNRSLTASSIDEFETFHLGVL